MGRTKKGYLKLVFIFLVILGLYFVVDYVTKLKIFPKKIHNSSEYNRLFKKYGKPLILQKTSPKIIKEGLTIIPGNIFEIKSFSNLPARNDNLHNNDKVKTDQGNMIDKILSNFEGYVNVLNKEINSNISEDKTKSTEKAYNNIPANSQKDKPKLFRCSMYRSLVLAGFKAKGKLIIIPLEENIYQCTYPYKTSFITYQQKNKDLIIYSNTPFTKEQVNNILNSKINKDTCVSWLSNWELKRSRSNLSKFYRLYEFTLPTSTTCTIINNKLVLIGKNIHKKSKLIEAISKNKILN